MKNKNLIIAIDVIVVIILAVFLFSNKSKNTAQNPAGTQNATTQENQGASVKDSLLGLLQSATGVKCSVSDVNGSYTVIAKGDKVKIDGISFASPQSQNPAGQKGTMINDGTWAYIWNGQQGMKFNLKETQQGAANTEEKATDWKGWASQMQASGAKYDCNPTVATDADFTPPANVTFQDLGELMKNLPQMQNIPDLPATPNQ
jgi:hypothetical protein